MIQHQVSPRSSVSTLGPNPPSGWFWGHSRQRSPLAPIRRRGLTDSLLTWPSHTHPYLRWIQFGSLQITPTSNPQSHFHRLQVAVHNRTTRLLGSARGDHFSALVDGALPGGYTRVYADHSALLQGFLQRTSHSSGAHCPPVLAKPRRRNKLRQSTSQRENQRDPA